MAGGREPLDTQNQGHERPHGHSTRAYNRHRLVDGQATSEREGGKPEA